MSTEILMPALSPTMTEGKLAKWLKQVGDDVHAGDVIAEIETDKATMEVEAVDEGKVAQLLVDEGTEGIAVNTPIAVLAADGEEVKETPAPPKQQEAAPPPKAAPQASSRPAKAEEERAASAERTPEHRAPEAETA